MSNPQILDRRSFENGKPIFSEGERGDAAYVVESGEVGIYKEIDGEVVKLGTIKQGGIFGEMAVIDGTPRMATALAEGHVVLVRVPKGVFDQKIAACDPFIRGLITIFLNNIRASHKLYNKRPRSLHDYIKMLDAYTLDIRTYVNEVNVEDFSADTVQALEELVAAVQKVKTVTRGHTDRRHSVLKDDDLKGVSLRAVLDKG
ncbi:MAG TPA: cyclic nucleotide-binding domain-containing protein [Candidatus Omnitrophota bacterium]|nr:cyclic nucleotide-binding domain-containing protein [Candidatus Omnitrophota bacterium]